MKEYVKGLCVGLGIYAMGLAIGYNIGKIDGETKAFTRIANDLTALINGIENPIGGEEKEA